MGTNYDDVRHNLILMLEELDERLTTITNDIRHADEAVEKDFEEQATQNENNEVQDFLGNSARVEIAAIKQAIARIDAGDYDVCQICGEAINPARLKAVPYSLQCIKCASLAEKH
jgi:RNA polymerase-binding transcription factor DksA